MAHDGHKLTFAGVPETAKAAVLLLHGRGDSAEGILSLTDVLETDNVIYAAPQAENNTWYPESFLGPLERNEPYLSQALTAVGDALADLESAGFARENIVLMGFSQGACLAVEFAARNPAIYGGVVALSGGLIGPDTRFETALHDYSGSLGDTPVFLGCGAVDEHIPEARVMLSAGVLKELGAKIDARIYPGMGHTINQEEIAEANLIIEGARRA